MDKTPSGVLCLNKQQGASSHDMINKIRRIYHTKSVGHAGTLDPLAQGVLPVMIGSAVKLSEYLMEHDKTYVALIRLGVTTSTQDITGEVLSRCNAIPDEQTVHSVAKSFLGRQMQIPPMYSAIKVGGRKLYDLARAGIEIERQPREIVIHSICAQKAENDLYSLEISCSKGTYIRTICEDIGIRLGCGGTMEALTRTVCGSFTLPQSYTVSQLESYTDEQLSQILIPTEKCLNLPDIILPEFYSRLARNGAQIYLSKLDEDVKGSANGTRYNLYDSRGSFFAVGEVRRYEEGPAIKPVKLFIN